MVDALKELGELTEPAIEELLIQLVADVDHRVREDAADVILQRKKETSLRVLTRRAEDESGQVRLKAAAAFALMKASDEIELARLRRLLHDREFKVQLEAAKSYWQLTRNAEAVLPILFEFRSADVSWICQEAFDLLAEMAKAGHGRCRRSGSVWTTGTSSHVSAR